MCVCEQAVCEKVVRGQVVCEQVVCVRKLCVCVSKLCVSKRGSAQPKTRTPHKDVGNNRIAQFFPYPPGNQQFDVETPACAIMF